MISPILRSILETRYGLSNTGPARVLTGGERNRVLRLESDRGPVVLRISYHGADPNGVAYEHALVRFMRRHVSLVPELLTARDGSTYFHYEGRVISLFEWLPGEIADRNCAAVRTGASHVLAQIHQAALRYPDRSPRPDRPSLRHLDWDRNREWNWEGVQRFLRPGTNGQSPPILAGAEGQEAECRREIAARLPQIEQERERLRTWVAQLAASNRPLLFAPVHGDFHRGNLLAEGDRITAVIDWDECRPEWLVWELARAVWEFCKCKQTHALLEERIAPFLAAYQEAGGPVTSADFDLIVPLIRCVRLTEALYDLAQAERSEPWDAGYTLHNLLALENLADSFRIHPPRLPAGVLARRIPPILPSPARRSRQSGDDHGQGPNDA